MPGLLDEVQAPIGRITTARALRLAAEALRMVWASARRDLRVVALCALALGLGAGAQVFLTSRALQAVMTDRTGLRPGVLVDLLALVAVTAAAKLVATYQAERERLVGELVARHTQGLVMDVAARLRLEAFEEPAFYDRLERATATAEIRPVQLASGVVGTASAVTAAAGITVGLLTISPLLGALVLFSVIPLWTAASHANRALYAFNYRMTHVDRTRSYVAGLLTARENAAEIRANGSAGFLRQRFDTLYDTRIAAVRGVMRQRLRAILAGGAVSAAVVAAVLILVGLLVNLGQLSVGEAGGAFVAIGLLSQRLGTAAEYAVRLHECVLFVEDFVTFVEPERRRQAEQPVAEAPATFRQIELRRVRFRYPSRDSDALREVDLVLGAGEVVALVGENGSGKTTLAKIIAGLYRPTGGVVYWDGEALTDATAAARRTCVAVTLQDFVRYRLTVAENIAMGRLDRRDEPAAIQRAARLAHADGFVESLPDGYETQLGSQFLGGVELSGGQWQRLALARTFFRDAALVILDEPTSALDPRAERAVFDDIRRLCAGRTVLLISHRFANVRSANRIYVLADGRIIESGTHAELMTLAGRYAELFTLQAESYVDIRGDGWLVHRR